LKKQNVFTFIFNRSLTSLITEIKT
jgi:hypothetical protein